MTTLEIRWGKLDELFSSMTEVSGQATQVASYFRSHVCDASGFDYSTSVLSPIADALPTVAGYFDDMHDVFAGRWAGVADAISRSAKDVKRVDESVSVNIDRLRGMGPSTTAPTDDVTVDVRLFTPNPLDDALVAPETGGAELNHNDKFDWVADTWDDAIGVINQAIGFLRDLGLSVDDVPTTSLREHIVYPLSANYEQIRANSDACRNVNTAMGVWGGNFTLLSGNVGAVMLGQTSLTLVAHVNLYGVAVRAMGQGVNAGSLVFDQIATVSERIAVEVEKALVLLAERIGKLSARIGTRLIPYVGWAVFLLELAGKGKEYFTDIRDEIEVLWGLVDDLIALVDEVKAWAETQADRLETFQEVLAAANQLPVVGNSQGVEDLIQDTGTIEQTLRDVAEFGEGGGDEEDTVDDRLNDLGEAQNDLTEVDNSEDDLTMAPGLPDGSYYPGSPYGDTPPSSGGVAT